MKVVITALLLVHIFICGLQAQTMIQDTLLYDTSYDDTLNLKPYEIALCVFKIPANGVIKGFNVPIAAIDGDRSGIEVEIWNLTYPFDSTGNSYDSNYVDENGWLGYYPSHHNNDTIPDYYPIIAGQNWNAFGETGLCAGTELVLNNQDPLNTMIWYGGFAPYTIYTSGDHWLDLTAHGYLSVKKDEYVGIFLKHYLLYWAYADTTPVVTFYSNNATEINNPYPLLIFSPSCRGISGEGGWHIRSAVLNVELAIEYESVSTVAEPGLPASFALMPNFPNPFNPTTSIRFDLPERSMVSMIIYDVLGREITTLIHNTIEPGFHEIRWDGKDDNGNPVSTGMYIYRFSAFSEENQTQFNKSNKLVLMK